MFKDEFIYGKLIRRRRFSLFNPFSEVVLHLSIFLINSMNNEINANDQILGLRKNHRMLHISLCFGYIVSNSILRSLPNITLFTPNSSVARKFTYSHWKQSGNISYYICWEIACMHIQIRGQ